MSGSHAGSKYGTIWRFHLIIEKIHCHWCNRLGFGIWLEWFDGFWLIAVNDCCELSNESVKLNILSCFNELNCSNGELFDWLTNCSAVIIVQIQLFQFWCVCILGEWLNDIIDVVLFFCIASNEFGELSRLKSCLYINLVAHHLFCSIVIILIVSWYVVNDWIATLMWLLFWLLLSWRVYDWRHCLIVDWLLDQFLLYILNWNRFVIYHHY